jgi:hypothetical protein
MSTAVPDEAVAASPVPCRVCAQPIPAGAKKCTRCNEFQSPFWRVAAGLDLKGLLALLPLLALIYAFLAERVEPKNAKLQIFPIGCTRDTVEVFGSNVGNRAAAVTAAGYSVGNRADGKLLPQGDAVTRVFAANDSHVARWKVDLRKEPGGLAPHGASEVAGCQVTLRFAVLEFNGRTREIEAKCVCPS